MRTYLLDTTGLHSSAAALALEDEEIWNGCAAEHVLWALRRALTRRDAAAVALAGGSTPKGLYRLLAERRFNQKLDWERVHVFWGDERLVPLDSPESNYGLAARLLLKHIPVPEGNIHPMPTETSKPEEAADDYAETLRETFTRAGLIQPAASAVGASCPAQAPPRFDLIILGLGPDGHTASLFPGSAALDERERWVVPTDPGTTQPLVPRLTMTLPIINRARHVLFLVNVSGKTGMLRRILLNREDWPPPAGRVRPEGDLLWLIHDAEGRLESLDGS